MNRQRLDKTLSAQGLWSRKEAKALIRRGAVLLNGQPCRQAEAPVDWDSDSVTVEGKALSLSPHSYLLLNKPKGVVSATQDPQQPTVLDLIPPELQRKGLFPAGRLDKDSTGLLLITDDGDFAHRLLSPKKHVQKEYQVRVDGCVTPEMVEAFRLGVNVHNEYTTLPSRLTVLEHSPQGDLCQVILREGLYHQIKRMFRSFGLTVLELHRCRMGALSLDPKLAPGQCRPLTPEELQLLDTREALFDEEVEE